MKKIISIVVAAACGGLAWAEGEISLSLQAYSFRTRTFVETVQTAKRLGFKYIESYPGQRIGAGFEGTTDYHGMPPETLQKLKAFLAASGVELVSYGVTGAGSEEEWGKLTDFAKALGIRVIQIEAQANVAALDMAERAAERSGVDVALHNHTQPDGQPQAVLKELEGRGRHIGAGSDIGHWAATGIVPLDGVKLLKGRFLTLHMIDKSDLTAAGRLLPLGSGVCDIAGVLNELKAQGFRGFVTLEDEGDSPSFEEEVAASVRWFRAWEAGELAANGQLKVSALPALWRGFSADSTPDTWHIADPAEEQAALKKKLQTLEMLAIDPASRKGNAPGFANETAEKAFGADAKAKYCQPWTGKVFVSCALAKPEAAVLYTLGSSNDVPERDPSAWSLYGSDDEKDWVLLDHREHEVFVERFFLRGFRIDAPKTCRFYKLEITAHAGDVSVQFSRFALFGRSDAALQQKLAGLKQLEVDGASIKGNKPGYGSEQPEKAFGTNPDTKYCQIWDGKGFVSCALPQPGTAVFYTVGSSNDGPGRDPAAWTLYGSDDGENWTGLDSREDEDFLARKYRRGFEIKSPKQCKYYKLEITANHDNQDMQFSCFALFGK